MSDVPENALKVLGYVRVSTREQADAGLSLAVQTQRVRDFCALHGLGLVDVVADGGRSGESLRRKGIKEVFARLDAGEASGLVVAKIDRLTRSVRDWSGLVEDRFGKPGGTRLFSVNESIDLSTPHGRMIGNMLTTFGEFELDTGVDRSESVMGAKRARGEQLGTIPYGSMLAEDGKTLVANLAEAGTIGLIRELRGRGLTFRAIAKELDARKVPSRNGRPWSHSTVAKILGRSIAEIEGLLPESHPTGEESS